MRKRHLVARGLGAVALVIGGACGDDDDDDVDDVVDTIQEEVDDLQDDTTP